MSSALCSSKRDAMKRDVPIARSGRRQVRQVLRWEGLPLPATEVLAMMKWRQGSEYQFRASTHTRAKDPPVTDPRGCLGARTRLAFSQAETAPRWTHSSGGDYTLLAQDLPYLRSPKGKESARMERARGRGADLLVFSALPSRDFLASAAMQNSDHTGRQKATTEHQNSSHSLK